MVCGAALVLGAGAAAGWWSVSRATVRVARLSGVVRSAVGGQALTPGALHRFTRRLPTVAPVRPSGADRCVLLPPEFYPRALRPEDSSRTRSGAAAPAGRTPDPELWHCGPTGRRARRRMHQSRSIAITTVTDCPVQLSRGASIGASTCSTRGAPRARLPRAAVASMGRSRMTSGPRPCRPVGAACRRVDGVRRMTCARTRRFSLQPR